MGRLMTVSRSDMLRANVTVYGRYTPRRVVRLRALWWEGKRPKVGEFFAADRARVAYEIIDIRPTRAAMFALICLRWHPRDVPAGVTVHLWRWAPRHGIER